MRENLIPTSSIFSKEQKDSQYVNVEESFNPSTYIEEELDYNTGSFQRCRIITHDDTKPEDTISLVKLFPDSKVCILFNPHHDAYFVGSIPDEHLYDYPFTHYEVTLVTVEMIVLKVKPLEGDELVTIIARDGNFEIVDNPEFETFDEKFVRYRDEVYNLETSEIVKAKSQQEGKLVTFTFEKYQLQITSEKQIIYTDTRSEVNIKTLLADSNGFYFGYYLKMDSTGVVNLNGKRFHILSRPTLTIALLQEIGSYEDVFILTCKKQLLIRLNEFTDRHYSELQIENGIAMLFSAEEEDGQKDDLNIFTPNHQTIILEPRYKIDFDSVGNGIYFARDQVLLLDNGSLIFVKKGKKRNQIIVKGRTVDLPVRYLGEV